MQITSHHEYVYLKRNKETRSHKGGMSNTKSIQCSVSWNCRRCVALKHYKHLFLLTKWLNYFNANNHKFPLYEWLFSLSAFNSISWPFGWLRWKISVFIMSFYFNEWKISVFFLLNSKTFFYSLSSITSIYVDVKNLKWIPCFASQQHVFIEMDVK